MTILQTRQVGFPILAQHPRQKRSLFARQQPQRSRKQRATGAARGPSGGKLGLWRGERPIPVAAKSQRHGSPHAVEPAADGRQQPTPHRRDRRGHRTASWSIDAHEYGHLLGTASAGEEEQPDAPGGSRQARPFSKAAGKAAFVGSDWQHQPAGSDGPLAS